MKKLSVVCVLACLHAFTFSYSASAEIRMGTPFSDGAVLQRGMKVPVWGTVSPAKGKVTVEFAGQVKSANVDAATGAVISIRKDDNA